MVILASFPSPPYTQCRREGLQDVGQFGVTVIAHLSPILLLILVHELVLCYLVARQVTQEIVYTAFTVFHCVWNVKRKTHYTKHPK